MDIKDILKGFGHILVRKDFLIIDNLGINDIVISYDNLLGFDLLNNGDLMLKLVNSCIIMFEGGGYQTC